MPCDEEVVQGEVPPGRVALGAGDAEAVDDGGDLVVGRSRTLLIEDEMVFVGGLSLADSQAGPKAHFIHDQA